MQKSYVLNDDELLVLLERLSHSKLLEYYIDTVRSINRDPEIDPDEKISKIDRLTDLVEVATLPF